VYDVPEWTIFGLLIVLGSCHGSVFEFGRVRFSRVRFGRVRFGRVRFGRVRFSRVRF
jgi:hypothetical protein